MRDFRMVLAALCLALVVSAGCDRTQKREEAINRGEGQVQTGALQCRQLKGKWLGDPRGCRITPSTCTAIGGSWDKHTGCTTATSAHDGCSNTSGVAAANGQCVIAELSAIDLDAAWTCQAAQGQWLADTGHCRMTAHLCAQSADTVWRPGIGCEMPSTADQCIGLDGLHVIDGRCILTDLSREDLEGNEELERARSKLNQ